MQCKNLKKSSQDLKLNLLSEAINILQDFDPKNPTNYTYLSFKKSDFNKEQVNFIEITENFTITRAIEEKYGDRIELLGVKFKDPLVLCQILIAIVFIITFIQSGLDKVIDRQGNLIYFKDHFSNSILKNYTSNRRIL